ncbi:bryoporin-like [Siniperca chuatsi]|nr:bryoporin-like [Siniperca chuatsi]XP_044038041.1 bryoporin-like [Siniperca chuatsi]XP_044038042.1 bryoporin-like [Siniperca chuatsi]XP_044038043.1 bryoporin-like [Siniperca chuatsi]XP_044038044.1 bryoporin-like [Siniperca chuatsi]
MAEITGAAAGVIGMALGISGAIAEAIPTYRQCTIEIKNNCTHYSLCNPRIYIESGGCAIPLSPFIAPSTSDIAQFSKTPNTARGSVGVFTYDLLMKDTEEHTEKIAVMFSVPYDFNLFLNWYAVGVFDMSKKCDHDLYLEMYYKSDNSFIKGKASDPCLMYKGDNVTIMAAMSDSYQPVIKLQVTDKGMETKM